MQQFPPAQRRPNEAKCSIGNGLMGYAVEWSPFDGQRLAISASQNFGIIGTGEQIVARYQNGVIQIESRVRCKDGVFDCAWSESNPNHIVSACGDGSIMLMDTSTSSVMNVWTEHAAEVYSVDWNLANRENIVSGSWDYAVKLWHPSHSQSIRTYREHNQCVYASQWHPRHADIFASCAGDGLVKIWSMNDPRSVQTISAHAHECLTLDFNKYNEHELITGSVDRSIRGWDRRNPHRPLFQLDGHAFAVRRVKCSPHSPTVIGSVSYDMSFILWDSAQENSILAKREDHTEFVLGVDFNMFDPFLIATVSWDETVHVYHITGRETINSTSNAQAALQEIQKATGAVPNPVLVDHQPTKPVVTHAEQDLSQLHPQPINATPIEESTSPVQPSEASTNQSTLSNQSPSSSISSSGISVHPSRAGSLASPLHLNHSHLNSAARPLHNSLPTHNQLPHTNPDISANIGPGPDVQQSVKSSTEADASSADSIVEPPLDQHDVTEPTVVKADTSDDPGKESKRKHRKQKRAKTDMSKKSADSDNPDLEQDTKAASVDDDDEDEESVSNNETDFEDVDSQVDGSASSVSSVPQSNQSVAEPVDT